MREDALYEIARDGIEPRRLALVASTHAALDGLSREPAEWEPAGRAVVSDDDGQTVRLTLYTEIGAVSAVGSIRAITLAGQLIEAALPRLSVE